MKKILIAFTAALLVPFTALTFNWPQTEQINSDSFHSYFAQLRGNTISNSLIFQEPSTVQAADQGFISMIMVDYQDDSDFFPTALGNTIVICHNDSLATIYGNLEEETVINCLFKNEVVENAEVLGQTGNSAWQHGKSSLEFQVIDLKNRTSINPRILMPRIGNELELYTQNVTLIAKNGRRHELAVSRSIPAGTYKIYQKRLSVAVPYKTQIFLNGTLVDSISFGVLSEEDNKVCVKGNKSYSKEDLYPDKNLILTGEANFTAGQILLQISLKDINEKKEYNANYSLSVY